MSSSMSNLLQNLSKYIDAVTASDQQSVNFIKNSKSKPHHKRPSIRKHHYALGTAVVLIGSWITHTTTARVYDDFTNQQALAFAEAMPNKGIALNGGLPDDLFTDGLKVTKGPFSDVSSLEQSPLPYKIEQIKPPLSVSTYTVKRGDTLGSIFKKQGLDHSLPHNISQHEEAKQLVSLSIGRDLSFGHNDDGEFKQLRYQLSSLEELVVEFDGETVIGTEIETLPYMTLQKSVSAEISTSLYESALDAGLTISLVMEMVRIFGWDIDFVLDIREGDTFHVVYEQHKMNGEILSHGNILAAEFTTQNQTYRAIRFADDEGNASYYTPQGESMLGTFLRSPVEFSRISSRFGKRKHPILKKWRTHKGVDYAASRGTPIRATADGKIVLAGKKGGYGKTVVIRHAGRFSTLYGHMNGYAKGIRSGVRVKQGDVIGYIGSTGLATGPHLHYEFRLDGVHRNPLTFKTPKASSVSSELRSSFDLQTSKWMAKLDSIANSYQLAKSNGDSSNLTEKSGTL